MEAKSFALDWIIARVRACFGGSHEAFLCYIIIHSYNIDDARSELDKTFGNPFIVEPLKHEKWPHGGSSQSVA